MSMAHIENAEAAAVDRWIGWVMTIDRWRREGRTHGIWIDMGDGTAVPVPEHIAEAILRVTQAHYESCLQTLAIPTPDTIP